MKRVKIIENYSKCDFEKEINKYTEKLNIESIKFCVDSIYGGTRYYAMIIYQI